MPFNITDPNGRPIGIIVKRYTLEDPNAMIFMVGLTKQRYGALDIDNDRIRSNIAFSLDCQTMFGSIKEEKFDQALREIWRNEYSHLGYYKEDFLIRRLMLNRSVPMDQYLRLEGFDFEGYVLLDGRNLTFSSDYSIVMNWEDTYIQPIQCRQYGFPLHAKITDIPIVGFENIPLSGAWDHVHQTKLSAISGNVEMKLNIPMVCPLRKDTAIQIYFAKEKIAGIYGDGIFYSALM